ncbi:PREDICTED: probable receptor-like protein kinase At1g80640 [Fragaria vesca subsp. vesca]|uniref:probable receptor-like protein kinase At1g80640 n=1 Tax=Fragaria vesca subsp. vesca TaxID=101020 RepID=UPI0002C2F24A|nr:PREDICTED: probable receptor-like protein kinase At1g80640 [Fragaria vesca subsp. vesca]XP_011458834.1 PREDICTED: probable receptor-like protein kinase At1g80640 [Fragaria vesca subsp. vesca]
MKLLVVVVVNFVAFVLVDQNKPCPFCVGATVVPDPLVSSITAPLPSPNFSPIPPIASSMASFSPGIQQGSDENQMDPHKKMIIALTVTCATLGAVLLSLLCLWFYHRKYKFLKRNAQSSDAEKELALSPFFGKFNSIKMVGKKGLVTVIEYKLIEKGTSNFQESNILGEGGFGCVYRAHLDENLIVAVKKLDCATQDAEKEFENEVELLHKIQHPNIISFLGCSIDGDSRFIVYELMPNGSLETQLHGPSHGSALTWPMRMKIALDTARGLEYLHEYCNPPVIHRDLKTSNILLDANFNAKLSDFGLAVADGARNNNNIKLSGTLGYVAPEYLLDGKLTDKSDVYGFGVVLLELLLGRRPVEKLAPTQCQSIVTWAMPQLTDRSKLPHIVDPVIKDTMDLKHLYQVAAVAVLCVQPEPSYRPLITDVLHSLVPLVPVELGGTLRGTQPAPPVNPQESSDH